MTPRGTYIKNLNNKTVPEGVMQELVRSLALQPLSAGNYAEFSHADNSKTIQSRTKNLTSLDSLASCESIYVYFKPNKLVRYELNHFKDNQNTILDQFWSLNTAHEMARETKILNF